MSVVVRLTVSVGLGVRVSDAVVVRVTVSVENGESVALRVTVAVGVGLSVDVRVVVGLAATRLHAGPTVTGLGAQPPQFTEPELQRLVPFGVPAFTVTAN